MNLILHHFVKDIRSQRWLLLLWALLIFAYLGADLLILQSNYEIASAGEKIHESPFLTLGSGVVWTLLLVGLVQSEPVIGSTSFWLTRPVPRWVVIPSKLTFLAAFLLLPWIALLPSELLLFHGAPALLWRAVVPALWTLAAAIVTLWIATFTRTFTGFLVATLAFLFVALFLAVLEFRLSSFISLGDFDHNSRRVSLLVYISLAGLIVSTVVQHFARKTSVGISIAVGSVVVGLIAGLILPMALPRALSLTGLVSSSVDLKTPNLETVKIDFRPDWPASLTWSQTTKPVGGTTSIALANGVVVNGKFSSPVSGKDDEGNPVVARAIVAAAQLTPVTTSTSRLPLIETVEASFTPSGDFLHPLPRRDYVLGDKSDQFDLVKVVEADLPGIAITTATRGDSTLAPTPLFKLDESNLKELRGKTGDLKIALSGREYGLLREAVIPLDGEGSLRTRGGIIHTNFATQQSQTFLGFDFPLAGDQEPMLDVQSRREAVWIGFKAVRFFLPARTDELIRGEASQALETLGEVVSVEERAEVLS